MSETALDVVWFLCVIGIVSFGSIGTDMITERVVRSWRQLGTLLLAGTVVVWTAVVLFTASLS